MVGDRRSFYATLSLILMSGIVYLFSSYEDVILGIENNDSEIERKRDSISELTKQKNLLPIEELERQLRLIGYGSPSRIEIIESKSGGNIGNGKITGDVLSTIIEAINIQKKYPIKFTFIESNGKSLKLDFEYYGTRE